MNKMTKTALAVAALISAPSFAGYTLKVGDDAAITFGGYIKADAEVYNGNTEIGAAETRFNVKAVQGDVTGFLEYDFAATGNDIDQPSLRLRHAFVKYKGLTVGQAWTTLTPLAAIPDTVEFGSSIYNQRQGLIRYEANGFAVALEDPGSNVDSAATATEGPEVALKYTLKQDWGQVTVGGLAHKTTGDYEFSYSVWGKIKTFGKDDFRFYYVDDEDTGLSGSSVVGTSDDQWSVAYRHFWTGDLRSTAFYQETAGGTYEHYGVNLIKQVTKAMSVGIEIGEKGPEGGDNNEVVQLMAKFVL